MKNYIIETIDLSKIFTLRGKKKKMIALNNVNISIKKGEIYGLLGPNGAGKTTLIYILTTLRQPTSGTAFIDGYDVLKKPRKAKAKISLMLDSKMSYGFLTGYENLCFVGKIFDIPDYKTKIYEIAKQFGMENWLNQLLIFYSTGMRMKLALCRTLLLNREILILDEPTMGLDVETKLYMIKKIKEMQGTILITSHDMSVIERLCDRIAFINNGKIVKVGTKEDLQKFEQSEIKIVIEVLKNKNQLINELNEQEYITEIVNTKNGCNLSIKSRDFYQDLLIILSKYKILKVKEQEQRLDDLFLNIIKKDNITFKN